MTYQICFCLNLLLFTLFLSEPCLKLTRDIMDRTERLRIDKFHACGYDHGLDHHELIIVHSDVGNFEARAAIRDTWGRNALERAMYLLFMLGDSCDPAVQVSIEAEDAQYEDILQTYYLTENSPENRTLNVLAMMKWVDRNCERIFKVLKADDDMLINLEALSSLAESNIGGNIITGMPPNRLIHALSRDEYSCSTSYWKKPTAYINSTGYLFTPSVAKVLYRTFRNQTQLNCTGNVYITGALAREAQEKIKLVHNYQFLNQVNFVLNGATFSRIVLASGFTPQQIRAHWNRIFNLLK